MKESTFITSGLSPLSPTVPSYCILSLTTLSLVLVCTYICTISCSHILHYSPFDTTVFVRSVHNYTHRVYYILSTKVSKCVSEGWSEVQVYCTYLVPMHYLHICSGCATYLCKCMLNFLHYAKFIFCFPIYHGWWPYKTIQWKWYMFRADNWGCVVHVINKNMLSNSESAVLLLLHY